MRFSTSRSRHYASPGEGTAPGDARAAGVALVGPQLEENLSLACLAGALRDSGRLAVIIDCNDGGDVARATRAVLRARPDLVGVSLVSQHRYADAQALIGALRSSGYRGHITAGGHFASLRAREVLTDTPGLDSILHHDGEHRITALAGMIERGELLPGDLDGVSWREGMPGAIVISHRPPVDVPDLDHLPAPARRRPDRTIGVPRAPLVSSRGCSGSCSFCSIHAWHRQVASRRLRFRDPARVAAEMIALHREHGVRVFVFHDDDFIHPHPRVARERARAILERAEDGIGERFAFVIKCRPDRVEEDLFAYLLSKGLVRAFVGIEGHAASSLTALNRRATPAVNMAALETLGRLGVYACFNLLLFHPDTTMAELRENLDFLSGRLDSPFDVGRTELYAHSILETRMLAEGRAIGDYRGYDYVIADPAAERAFRLFYRIMGERHFGRRAVVQSTQDLGLRQRIFERLYPGSAAPELAARVNALIADVNRTTVAGLERIATIAMVNPGTLANRRMNDEAGELGAEIETRTRRHELRRSALETELELRAWAARRGEARCGVTGAIPARLWRSVAALPGLGMALTLLSCIGGGGETVCDPPPPPVHFSTDIEPVLDQHCATADCHDSDTPAAHLPLHTGASYAALVNVPSEQLPSMDLVRPHDLSHSYLHHKIDGSQAGIGGSGDRMPPGDALPDSVVSDIAWWIVEGAEDD